MPYNNQLHAIHEMLASHTPEIVQDGYDLLFKLWLENLNSINFNHDMLSIVVDHTNFIGEFKNRFDELATRNGSTESYLRERLKNLASEAARFRQNISAKDNTSIDEDHNKKTSFRSKKIFISYSHKDEKYKDELVTILIPLQDEGIIEIWQDREIDPGDDWYQAIQGAMNTCDLALLLISADFLTSRFIQDEELSRLLKRRKKKGLRVVPIIIRPCMWQVKSVLKDIQALPKDGKPVSMLIDKDQAWTEVGMAVADIAKKV